jgi:HPt (histidine-containing phosphotransfer) domain-containing protein
MTRYIDEAELDRQTFGDADIRREVVSMFREQAPLVLQAIIAANGSARADAAHRLKGSALALGATSLADAAAAVERNPSDSSLPGAVERALDGALADLARILGE